jgi:hypothetical protein
MTMSFKIPDSGLQIGGRARPRMVSLVETMMTADSLWLTACGPDEGEIRTVEARVIPGTQYEIPDERRSGRG